MRILLVSIISMLTPLLGVAQDPMPVLGSTWQRVVKKAVDSRPEPYTPMRAVLPDDKYFQRNAREQRTDKPLDPNKDSVDARSAQLEKMVQESRSAVPQDSPGFSYSARVRNESSKTVRVIFWEYRFIELANPTNVVRRQFLCSVNLKKGSEMDLSAFSLLAPSESIDVNSLGKTPDKLFDERVQIDRIEFSDDTVIQRGGWKYDDYRSSIEKAASAPWGKEICRLF